MAVVAPPSFSLAACLDFDIPLRRVVQFVLPSDVANWAQVIAAIVEGFDLVMLADQHQATGSQARQLVARNRERGSVLIRVGGPAWPDAADLRFDVSSPEWSGLGQGHGHLRARKVAVQVAGRRYHGRKRAHEIMLPALEGGVMLAPVVAAAAANRFAGADIDAMLDVVDRSHDDTAHANDGHVGEGADQDATAAAPGLDAIA